jgi:hypothetical protein
MSFVATYQILQHHAQPSRPGAIPCGGNITAGGVRKITDTPEMSPIFLGPWRS